MEDKEEKQYQKFIMTDEEKKAQEDLLKQLQNDVFKEHLLFHIVCTYPKNIEYESL